MPATAEHSDAVGPGEEVPMPVGTIVTAGLPQRPFSPTVESERPASGTKVIPVFQIKT